MLEIENISKVYDKSTVVLDDVSFKVEDGEFLSILGPSGCGKTTLLRILIGLSSPTSGKILQNDEDITSLDPSARKMGIVFQNYALFENLTVFQNVEYALKRKKGVSKKDATEKSLSMIEHMGLTAQKDQKPKELSGGQQQRVAIARTLVMNPKTILFDEPMSALDVATRLQLREVIKNIQKEYKTTIIYITHDQEEAFAMSDRILVMSNSHLVQIDTPENIIKNPANDYVRDFVLNNLQRKIDSLVKYVHS